MAAKYGQRSRETRDSAKATRIAGLMAGNLGRAALADVGNRLGGRPGAHHGNVLGRMDLAMSEEAKLLENRNRKPAPGSTDPEPATKREG